MRIGVDATRLRGDMGGAKQYFHTLFTHLLADGEEEYVFFCRPQNREEVGAIARQGIHVVTHSFQIYPYAAQLDGYFSPFGLMRPRPVPCPTVVMVHDTLEQDFPEFFSVGDRRSRALNLPNSARCADHVLTISEFCCRQIQRHYGVAPNRITVAPHALPPAPSPQPLPLPPRPYLLYPANGWPHKNHGCLWPALTHLSQRGITLDLVLTGANLPFTEAIAQHHLTDHVHLLGYRTPGELQFLYRHALALVVPSRYEGFGLPLLEAMESDCPVVAAHIPALLEVADTAALWFDPHDPTDLARAIAQLISEPALRPRLIERGRQQRQRFTPKAMVSAHRLAFARARSHFQPTRFWRQMLYDEPRHLLRVLRQPYP